MYTCLECPPGLTIKRLENKQVGVIANKPFVIGETLFTGVKKKVSVTDFDCLTHHTFIETMDYEREYVTLRQMNFVTLKKLYKDI